MKLKEYMEKHDLKPNDMAAKIIKAADSDLSLSGVAVRHWASGSRMPGTILINLIIKATNGAVKANDLHLACVEYQAMTEAAE